MTALLVALTLLGAAGLQLRRRFTVARVVGASMLPTLAPGDQLLARRGTSRGIRAGDIVIVTRAAIDPQPPGGTLPATPYIVKRVVATAGAAVRPEWLPADLAQGCSTVPVGSLVLLGDNPVASRDSRHTGYYPVADVLAVVVRRLR